MVCLLEHYEHYSVNSTPISATVKLVRSVRVPSRSSVVASVQVDGVKGDVLLEPVEERSERIEESLVHPEEGTGMSKVVVKLSQLMLSVVRRLLRLNHPKSTALFLVNEFSGESRLYCTP